MTTQIRDIRREGSATPLSTAGARLPVSLDPSNWGYIAGLALISEVLGAGIRFRTSAPDDSVKVTGRPQLVVVTGSDPSLYFHNGVTATAWVQFMGGFGRTEQAARIAGDRLTSTQVSSASALQAALNAQRSSAEALELVITANISGTRSGSPYSYAKGDVLYVAPMSDAIEARFNVEGGDSFPAIPEDGHEYILYGRDRIGSGGSNDPIRFWRIPNLVPNTPGTQSGIGRVLTVTGENDRDYAWRTLDVAAAVAAYLRDNPAGAGVDTTARTAAATNAAAIAALAEHVDDEIAEAASGSTHAQIGDASLTLLQFGDGRGVWTKEEILALRTIELNTPFDSARVGGYGIGSNVSFNGVNYTAIAGTTQGAAFDPAEWTRDAEQPTPYYQYSILTRLRNAAGLPSGADDQWVMTIAQNPGHSAHSIQWLETSMQDSSKLELFQKDDTGHWVEPAGALVDGLVLFRFSIVDTPAKQLFRNATDTRDVIRDNLHFLLGKATNIGNYLGLGVDVRITIGSQSIDPTTPRRVPHIPQPMLEGELIRLTEDDVPHPTAEQVYRFGPQSSDFNPNYQMVFPGVTEHVNVFGIALAGTFGGVLDRFGPDNRYRAFGSYLPDILRASGIRAIYVREDHPSRIYIRMARALVSDAEVNTLKFRLGAFDHDAQMVRWPYTTAVMVPVPDETTADVRTFYCEPTNVSGPQTRNMYTVFVMLGADTLGSLAFSMLKGAGAWLHYNSLTAAVSFEEGSRYAEGFYEGQADGSPVRVYLPRNPGDGTTFTPSKANLYSAVKEIFHPATNAGVTADDTNNELDVAGGGGGGSQRSFGSGAGQIASWAQGNSVARIPDAKISTALARSAAVTTQVNAIGDLRARYDQSSTPVAQDRFFFTDENQSGDPIRYVVFNNLAAAILGTLPSWVTDNSVDIPDSKLDVVLSSDSVIINDVDGNVAPTADNRNRIRYHGRQFYYNEPVHYTDPTVTYRNLAATDLPGGYTVLGPGVYQVTPSLSGVANNAVWYSLPAGHWNRKITFGGRATAAYWNPNFRWRGVFASESEADAHVTAVGDVVIFGGQARVVASYTSRTPDEFRWTLFPDQIDADSLNLPDAAAQKAFRAAIGAAAVSVVTTALPAGTATNNGDWIIVAQDIASGIVWQDFAGTALTSAEAGDLGVYVGGRTWQRVGNLIKGPAKIRTQALTSAAAITWNVAVGHTATLTLGVNATLRISGGADGDLAFLKVKQDGTGSRTLALHSSILRFKDIAAPTLSTAANAVDLLMFVNDNGTWNYVGMR